VRSRTRALVRHSSALLALAGLALLLAACSDDSDPAVAATAAVSTTATVAASEARTGSATPTVAAAATGSPTAATPTSTQCRPGGPLTPAQTEGPYYKAGAPERASLLEPGQTGTRLVISGRVLTAACEPVAGARIDVWQTDAAGQYDNAGFRMRGVLRSGADGSYRLETVVPGEYPGRTQHIHVKVQAPGGPELTTQLYLPDSARNASDGIFDATLLLRQLQRGPDGVSTRFDFVIRAR
jgi:protocatechuate 3,4-dioxygenase beta subunit